MTESLYFTKESWLASMREHFELALEAERNGDKEKALSHLNKAIKAEELSEKFR